MANPFLDGIGKVIGKIADNVQGRIERLKNEKERLLNERQKIFVNPPTNKSADRLIAIDTRVRQINEALGNKATD